MHFPDISEYYRRRDRVEVEEKAWCKTKLYERHAASVNRVIELSGAKTVLEVACGSAWLPTLLPPSVAYTGVDKLDMFLEFAQKKNPGSNRTFYCGDMRELLPKLGTFDLVCSFATLKHFGLHEWNEIAGLLLSKAPLSVLEITVSTSDYNNGKDFHHVFVSPARVRAVVQAAGHEIVAVTPFFEGVIPDTDMPSGQRSIGELAYFTRKKPV